MDIMYCFALPLDLPSDEAFTVLLRVLGTDPLRLMSAEVSTLQADFELATLMRHRISRAETLTLLLPSLLLFSKNVSSYSFALLY